MDTIDKIVTRILNINLLKRILEALDALVPFALTLSVVLLASKYISGLMWMNDVLLSQKTLINVALFGAISLNFHRSRDLSGNIIQTCFIVLSFFLLNANFDLHHIPLFVIWVVIVDHIELGVNKVIKSVLKDSKKIPDSVSMNLRNWLLNVFLYTSLIIICVSMNKLHIWEFLIRLESMMIQFMSLLPVYLLLMAMMLFLWTRGIHGDEVIGRFLDPFLILFMLMNLQTLLSGGQDGLWLNASFHSVFAMGTGTGMTLVGLAAHRMIINDTDINYRALSEGSLFNINEPIIFGLPIVYNNDLRIPFILGPLCSIGFAWLMTVLGILKPMLYPVPWITPPLIKSFLASGGDLISVLIEFISYAIVFVVYCIAITLTRKKRGVK